MMWNTKYGMMSGGRGVGGMMGGYSATSPDEKMSIASERSVEVANDYLERVSPDTRASEAERFYGYYTLHIEKDRRITGMLSVNGYSGEVWYHSWHGPFVGMQEG